MEAGNYHNPLLLKLEENAVRKAPHSGTATVPVDDGELQWMFRDCLNRGFDRVGKTLPKFWTDVVVPRTRFQQILIRLWGPDDRECHGFLNRPALTCSQEMTSERILRMSSDAVIKLRPLRIRQACRVRFQAFPNRVQEFCLLSSGETLYLISQIAHYLEP